MNHKQNFIPLSQPYIAGQEWKYLKECLDTGWVSSVGAYVNSFERKVADYIGCQHAVACVNGTSALHTALLVMGLEPNEEVIVPTLTFVAPANAIRYCGAYPVFMDVDKKYWQMDVSKLSDFLKKECLFQNKKLVNKHTRRVIRGIMPVHLLGHPVDMTEVMALAKKHHLWVVEDAAESIGALYKGSKVGSIGDIGCFSFNGNKIITAGGGGMLVTDTKDWQQKAQYLITQAKDDPQEYIHEEIGYNYRLTNIQAAVGVAQMEVLDSYIQTKKRIAGRYNKGLSDIKGLTLPQEAPWAQSIWWLYTILIDKKKFSQSSRNLLKTLSQKGIETRSLWHPLDTLKPFQSCFAYHVKVAYQLYEQALSLPSCVNLTETQQHFVIDQIKSVV